uniref:Uncharacterized protein n=1 Tax=Candidatus Kentrum sp. TC TaxID=2126339 RepID=A0A450Z189_9GAMM|nr:MAG: hypothetical protein BECKTC1821E_GA0114239_10861 [Candidatus Kentron sp. TC]
MDVSKRKSRLTPILYSHELTGIGYLFGPLTFGFIRFTYRKNKDFEKTGTLARNPPFGYWREALTCSFFRLQPISECLVFLKRRAIFAAANVQ